jgi:hypothetical protein
MGYSEGIMNMKTKKNLTEASEQVARPYGRAGHALGSQSLESKQRASQAGEAQNLKHSDELLWRNAVDRLQARSWASAEELEIGLLDILAEELHIPTERRDEVREFLEFVLEIDEDLAEQFDELKRRLVAYS